METRDPQQPKSVDEHLLAPPLFRALLHFRSGGHFRASGTSTLRIEWSRDTEEQLFALLRTGKIDGLASLVEAGPVLLGHPIVFSQLFHLMRIRRKWEADDLRRFEEEYGSEPSLGPNEPILPAGTKKAAETALVHLIAALVQGVLPGWTLTAPKRAKLPRKRGAPRSRKEWEDEELFHEFRDLLNCLERDEPFPIRNAPDGLKRAVELLQMLHAHSWRSVRYERLPDQPDRNEDGSINLDAWHGTTAELSDHVKQGIVQAAVQKQKVSKKLLVINLLAHYTNLSAHAVRNRINRTKPMLR